MAIPARYLVDISPRVISGGSADLETNGMLLTKSALLPSDTPAMIFTSASSVASLFGSTATETLFAQQYFTGVNNQQTSVKKLVIGRRFDANAPAFIRSGAFGATLEEFREVTAGSLSIKVNGTAVSVNDIDLSTATSFSEVANLVATSLGEVTGAYDPTLKMFVFTTNATGEDATIEFASEGDFANMLCLTEATGAVLSQGVDAMTEADNLEAIGNVTRNWVGFTTTWEASLDEARAFSAWADIYDDYVYFLWTADKNVVNPLTQGNTIPAKLMDEYNCTACVYGNLNDIAFALAVGASIAWERTQGMKVWFAKSTTGVSPTVTTESVASALDAIRCNYYGEFATRNADFRFFNRGSTTSSMYGFVDVLYGAIWFRNKIQRSCMDGFASVNRAPYNELGKTFIVAWCQDPINSALNNGVIDVGLNLSNSQKAQILAETDDENASNDIVNKGYYLDVTMPDASVRAVRGSPIISLYYAYAGAVQKIECPATQVI